MKIALICPSNMLYMPYVNNYEKILKELKINYTIIKWDRFNIDEDQRSITFRDNKIGHQRNYFDYFKYKNFIIKKLKETHYDKVIVFTLQLGYFLRRFLMKNYKGNYVLDIRDYNKIFKIHNFKRVINNSAFTVISSPGYEKYWLPESKKYIVNHNTPVYDMNSLRPFKAKQDHGKINISTIGVIRHWDANIDFVNTLKNSNDFNLIFHGEGTINDRLSNYIQKHKINNVQVYGRYAKQEEQSLYERTDLVNTILYNDDINCKSLLTNRLYNAALYGKPMLSLQGTYLAEQINRYHLGLVLNSFENIENKIKVYLKEFDDVAYEKGRMSFFENVIKENNHFKQGLKSYILS